MCPIWQCLKATLLNCYMIDTFAKLLEKLIEFAKAKKDAETRAFDLLVKPMFSDIKLIHEDYLQLFEECRHDLADGVEFSIVAKRLVVNRLEQEALRRSVLAFAESYAKNPRLSKYADFFRAVARYFICSDRWARGTSSSMLLGQLEHWVREESDSKFIPMKHSLMPDARFFLIRMTETFLQEIREAWDSICKSFAVITVESATA